MKKGNRKSNKLKRLLCAVLSLILVFNTGISVFAEESTKATTLAAGDTVTIWTPKRGSYATANDGTFSYMHWSVRSLNNTEYIGLCLNADTPVPDDDHRIQTATKVDNDILKTAVLLAPGNALYEYLEETGSLTSVFGSVTDEDEIYMFIHIAASVIYSGEWGEEIGAYWTDDERTYINNLVSLIRSIANGTSSIANGFDLDDYTFYIAYTEAEYQDIGWVEYTAPATLSLKKTSANTSLTSGNDCYSLAGAVYGVYTSRTAAQNALGNGSTTGAEVATLTTTSDGSTNTVELDAGTYYVAEISASTGYAIDETIYTMTLSYGDEYTVSSTETPLNDPVGISITKIADGDLDGDNDVASLEGTQFTIKYYDGYYTESTLPSEATRTWVIEVKEYNGMYMTTLSADYLIASESDALYYENGVIVLPLGTITIEETKTADGYTLEGATITVLETSETIDGTFFLTQITESDGAVNVQYGNEYTVSNGAIHGGFTINKLDLETGIDEAQGAATLEGAEFTLYNESGYTVTVDGKEYADGEKIAILTTDEDGYIETASDYLPYGTYRIVETKAPDGYLLSGDLETTFSITEDGVIVDLTNDEDDSISDQVKRGDVELIKVIETASSSNMTRLANVPFRITSLTTGESHIIVTDANGYASTSSSWNLHSYNTNQGETEYDGVWFNGYNDEDTGAEVDDSLGALPYDTYLLEEIRCEANEGYDLISIQFTVYRDSVTVDLGTLDNQVDVTEDPEKLYADADMTEETYVRVNEEIEYILHWVNNTTSTADVYVYDTMSAGLDFVEASIEPDEIIENEDGTTTLVWVIEDAVEDLDGYIYYTAVVNEEAFTEDENFSVTNTYEMQVGNNAKQFVEDLTNPVIPAPAKEYADEEMTEETYVRVGDEIGYSLTWSNTSGSAGTVTLYDTLTAGLTYNEGSASIEPTEVISNEDGTTTIVWTIAVEAGDYGTVSYTATVNETAFTEEEGYSVNNMYQLQIGEEDKQFIEDLYNPVVPKLEKDYVDEDMENGDYVMVTDSIGYALTWSNVSDDVTTITLYDTLTAGLTYDEDSASIEPDEIIENEDGTTTLVWVIEDVEAGDYGTVSYSATVNETAFTEEEGYSVNNYYEIQLGNDPKQFVNKLVNPVVPDPEKVYADEEMTEETYVRVGDEIGYSLTWSNTSESAGTVTLYDTLTAGLTYNEGSASIEPTEVISNEDGTTTIVWTIAVEAGDYGTVSYTATVNETAFTEEESYSVNNMYELQIGEEDKQFIEDLYNPVVPKLEKDYVDEDMENGDYVMVTDSIGYALTWSNVSDDVTTITLYDTLTAGLTYDEGSASIEPDEIIENEDGTTTLVWVIEDVEAGDYGTISYSATVNETAFTEEEGYSVNNYYEIQLGNDPKQFVNKLENPVVPDPAKEYADEEMTEETYVSVDDIIEYALTWSNTSETAGTVTLYDTLTAGLTYNEGSASIEPTEVISNEDGTTTIVWIIDVEAGDYGTVTYTVTVNENARTEEESYSVNNMYQLQIGEEDAMFIEDLYNPLTPPPAKEYTDEAMTEDTYVEVGDEIGYTLTWTNDTDEIVTVTLYDTLSAGLTYNEGSASIEPTEIIYNEDGTTTIVWVLEEVEARTSGTISYTVTVNDNALTEEEGYRVINNYELQINDEDKQFIGDLENPLEQPSSTANTPQTGDPSNIAKIIGGILIFGAAFLVFFKMRKKASGKSNS